MVHLSKSLLPPTLKGIKVHPDNPMNFEFVMDKGDAYIDSERLQKESSTLIKYFLAAITTPEQDVWVNLSPYEKTRIVPDGFGQTQMGRDLLAQDYLLKQITSSLMYPEEAVGRKFWKRVYEEAAKRFGQVRVPVNTFNKVWIMPDKAVVYENSKNGTAYVAESTLKVMLESDYVSSFKHQVDTQANDIGKQIIREIILPQLTQEVNAGENFTKLRQVYNSLILATWYKKKIKTGILNQVYANKNKISGIGIDDPNEKQRIYQQYLQAFKKGAYNYIKEEQDPISLKMIPRRYFSGGVQLTWGASQAMVIADDSTAFGRSIRQALGRLALLSGTLLLIGCQMQPQVDQNTPSITQALTQAVAVKAVAKPDEEIKTMSLGELWKSFDEHIRLSLGAKRLKSIAQWPADGKIIVAQAQYYRSMIEVLNALTDEQFGLFTETMQTKTNPFTLQEFGSKLYNLREFAQSLRRPNVAEMRQYISMYQRLFTNKAGQNVIREDPDRFHRFLIKTNTDDFVFFEDVLKEYPDLFYSQAGDAVSMQERRQHALMKLQALPAFTTVAVAGKDGFEAYDTPQANQLLRRYLLAILSLYHSVDTVGRVDMKQGLMVSLFAKITGEYDGMSAEVVRDNLSIGYQVIQDRGVKSVLAHELGHKLSIFGTGKNFVLNEFVADIYAYFFEQAIGENQYYDTVQLMYSRVLSKMFFQRVAIMLSTFSDPVKEEHYYARLQIEYLKATLGGAKAIDWKVVFDSLLEMEHEYQQGNLSQGPRDFIDFDAKNKIANFGAFVSDLIGRYLHKKGLALPEMHHEKTIVLPDGISLRLFVGLPGQNNEAMISRIKIRRVYGERVGPDADNLTLGRRQLFIAAASAAAVKAAPALAEEANANILLPGNEGNIIREKGFYPVNIQSYAQQQLVVAMPDDLGNSKVNFRLDGNRPHVSFPEAWDIFRQMAAEISGKINLSAPVTIVISSTMRTSSQQQGLVKAGNAYASRAISVHNVGENIRRERMTAVDFKINCPGMVRADVIDVIKRYFYKIKGTEIDISRGSFRARYVRDVILFQEEGREGKEPIYHASFLFTQSPLMVASSMIKPDRAQVALFENIPDGTRLWSDIELSRLSSLVDGKLKEAEDRGETIKDMHGKTLQASLYKPMLEDLIYYASDKGLKVASVDLLMAMVRVFNVIGADPNILTRHGNPVYTAFADQIKDIVEASNMEDVNRILESITPVSKEQGSAIMDAFKENAAVEFQHMPHMMVERQNGQMLQMADLGLAEVQSAIKGPIIRPNDRIVTLYSDQKLLETAREWTNSDFRYRIAITQDGDIFFIKRPVTGGAFILQYPFRLDYVDAGKALSEDVMGKIPRRYHVAVAEAINAAFRQIILAAQHPDPRLTNLLVKISLDDTGKPEYEFEAIDYERRDQAQSALNRRELLMMAVILGMASCALPDKDMYSGERIRLGEINYLTPNNQDKPPLLLIHGARTDPLRMAQDILKRFSGQYNVLLYAYDDYKRIDDIAMGLVNGIGQFRKQYGAAQPIKVVVHSYGAVVFRKAVLTSAETFWQGMSLIQLAPTAGGSATAQALESGFAKYVTYAVAGLNMDIGGVNLAVAQDPVGDIQKGLYGEAANVIFNNRIRSVHTIIVEGDEHSLAAHSRDDVRSRYRNGLGDNVEMIRANTGIGHGNVPNSQAGLDFIEKSLKLPDPAQIAKGGIDFNADKMTLDIQHNGGQGIEFKLDPAMVEQLRGATGFIPVILNIQPMTDLKQFLGITS